MPRLEYKFSMYTSDLVGNIDDRLGRENPDLPPEERHDLAKRAVEKIKSEGNGALSQGLTLYGAQIARKMIDDDAR